MIFMIVCKQCGTVFEEIYQTCPKCGTVYQRLSEENYDLPRRKMPGEHEYFNSGGQSFQHVEIELKDHNKKKSKTPIVVAIIISIALIIAVAVVLVFCFSKKNSNESLVVPKNESEEQLTPPEISSGSLVSDVSSEENSDTETSTEQTSSEDTLNNNEITAEVTKMEADQDANTDSENTSHEATFKVYVSYKINENEYETELGVFGDSEYHVGDKVTITVDPDNPEKIIKD